MGIGDVISKLFNKPKKDEGKAAQQVSHSKPKPSKHGHVDLPVTEDISEIKTENITGTKSEDSTESSDDSESDKRDMNKKPEEDKVQGLTDTKVLDVLSNVYDPEIPIDIVNLGLIYGVEIDGDKVLVKMTMTSPGCPASVQITAESKYLIEEMEEVKEAEIEIVWDPPWDPSKMSEDAKQSMGYD